MAHLSEPTSNPQCSQGRPPARSVSEDRLRGREGELEKMARLEEETSNALFETLEDWEAQLKQADQELRTLKRDPRGPSL